MLRGWQSSGRSRTVCPGPSQAARELTLPGICALGSSECSPRAERACTAEPCTHATELLAARNTAGSPSSHPAVLAVRLHSAGSPAHRALQDCLHLVLQTGIRRFREQVAQVTELPEVELGSSLGPSDFKDTTVLCRFASGRLIFQNEQ